MTGGRVLVTGGTGFVGRQVLAALPTCAPRHPIRLLAHRTPLPHEVPGAADVVRADLADPRSLGSLWEGVETVLHLACYIGPDDRQCEVVNGEGTEALVAVARAAGVQRILYLSTAAVYGYAVHRYAAEEDTRVAPATPISRSRARAERAVLAAGGIVLRPLFIYGEGDTRFLPPIMRALQRLPFLINGGRARLSVIAVQDLAAIIATLAGVRWGAEDAGPYHVDDTHPVTLGEIARTVGRRFSLPVPTLSLPYPLARWLVQLAMGRSIASTHRLFLVAHDHFYDSSRVWRRVPLTPGEPFTTQLEHSAAWYQRFALRGAALRDLA